jgi:putative aldouronate transport system permease protein
MSSIDPALYESARLDGANRLQMARHITIPSIMFVIVIMLLLEIGNLLEAGFEQVLLLYSPSVYKVADIIDTFVYREGLLALKYSFAAAVGLFKAVIAFFLLYTANRLANRLGQTGLW